MRCLILQGTSTPIFFDDLSLGSLCFNLSYVVAVAGCKSARTFRVGPGFGQGLGRVRA